MAVVVDWLDRRGGGKGPALPALHRCYILRAGAIRPNALSKPQRSLGHLQVERERKRERERGGIEGDE